jgi:predicted RNA binding protein YcfA (HicA-like mRNA interferase family)
MVETNTRKVTRRVKSDGWADIGGGEHDEFEHPDTSGVIIVLRHRELSIGVAKKIARAAGWS